jgi:tRNA modification GTPase
MAPAHQTRTIAALATAPGRSAVAVIRISGPHALAAAEALGCGALKPRRASLRALLDPATGEAIDRGLVLWFPAPASFTGEDMVELQVHGSRAVIASLLKALTESCGVALAEPGEFTRRAFDNGKMDLTQAEALADLVTAETTAQLKQANRQASGGLGKQAEAWRASLIRASAMLEAALDFPDEGAVPADGFGAAEPILARLIAEISAALSDQRAGERIREGLRIAIVGPPNAGKSTLLNTLARRDVAIVTEHAGTTRDVIEVSLEIGGYPAVLIDTAGLREAVEPVEREGVERARARAVSADLRILVWDGANQPVDWRALGIEPRPADILFLSKADLGIQSPGQVPDWPGPQLRGSAKTCNGIDSLISAMTDYAARELNPPCSPLVTRARHRHELASATAALHEALQIDSELTELIAEELRAAALALGRLTGRIDVEDILDIVFAEFCLGK